MKSVKLNIIIYIFNLIMVAIGNNGNKIGNDSNSNLIIQTLSGKFLELSCNELKIAGEISSNYLNTKFGIIETTISTICGGSEILNLSILENSFNILQNDFNNFDSGYASKSLFDDLSQNYYSLENSFNSLNFDSSYTSNATFLELSSNFYSLEESLTNYVLETSLNNYITKSQLDASFANINTNISGDFITRTQLDASFANINTNISGDFVTEASFNDLQNRGDNFFFFLN